MRVSLFATNYKHSEHSKTKNNIGVEFETFNLHGTPFLMASNEQTKACGFACCFLLACDCCLLATCFCRLLQLINKQNSHQQATGCARGGNRQATQTMMASSRSGASTLSTDTPPFNPKNSSMIMNMESHQSPGPNRSHSASPLTQGFANSVDGNGVGNSIMNSNSNAIPKHSFQYQG